jgi:LacI family transcriptional regulator
MVSRKRIAVVMLSGLTAYLHNMVMGLAEYAREHEQWQIFGLFVRKPHFSRPVHADGAIVFRRDMGLLDDEVPRVFVGTQAGRYPPGSIHSDNYRIGELAAEHLLERGLRAFSCVGETQRSVSSMQRRQGFRRRIRQAGGRYLEGPLISAVRFDESRSLEVLARWIQTLPEPIGVMGINDVIARQVADAARMAQRHVPDQIAIIGVDNEELMCMLSDPPLSSVDPGAKRLGYEAAALLSKIMQGLRPPTKPLVVPPSAVVVRATCWRSTITTSPTPSGSSGSTARSRSAFATCCGPFPSPGGRWIGDFASAWGGRFTKRFSRRASGLRATCWRGRACRLPRSPPAAASGDASTSVQFSPA